MWFLIIFSIDCTHILNHEVKRANLNVSIEHTIELEPKVTMDDKLKIQLLTSIAINMASPAKVPFVRLEHINAHQVKNKLCLNRF